MGLERALQSLKSLGGLACVGVHYEFVLFLFLEKRRGEVSKHAPSFPIKRSIHYLHSHGHIWELCIAWATGHVRQAIIVFLHNPATCTLTSAPVSVPYVHNGLGGIDFGQIKLFLQPSRTTCITPTFGRR